MSQKVIYKIESAINPEKIYIGSAIHFNNRKRGHINTLKTHSHKNKKLQAHFNKYGLSDLSFSIIEEVGNSTNLIDREQHYLTLLNPWFNICKVANSSLGVKRSEEYKRKMSLAKRGKKHRPECSAEKSMRMTGKERPKGFRHSSESKKKITLNHRNKKITLQYDLKGIFIKQWDFVKDASAELGINKVSISICCRGKIYTAGGFRYPGFAEPLGPIITKFRNVLRRGVLQYNLNGDFIKEWPSIRSFQNELKISESTICGCCANTGRYKTAGGFLWKYKSISA